MIGYPPWVYKEFWQPLGWYYLGPAILTTVPAMIMFGQWLHAEPINWWLLLAPLLGLLITVTNGDLSEISGFVAWGVLPAPGWPFLKDLAFAAGWVAMWYAPPLSVPKLVPLVLWTAWQFWLLWRGCEVNAERYGKFD